MTRAALFFSTWSLSFKTLPHVSHKESNNQNMVELVLHTGCIKKLNKPEIALRLCKAPQCTKFLIEIGCLDTDNVV